LRLANSRSLLGAGLVALAVVVFAATLDHAWLNYDDDVYITGNPALREGLTSKGVAWAFTTFHGANWFPLTWLSWLLDYELYGLSPRGFHAGNLLLHALDTLLLFLALAKLTGNVPRSAFVAAVFAAHPLHVESVAWAAARKDPLSALFFMLALLLYARQRRPGPSPRLQAAVLGCLALGLMAKPIVASLPLVLLLLDDWPLGRLRRADDAQRWDVALVRRALLEKLPLFALVAAFGLIAFEAQRSGGAVATTEILSPKLRVENALVSYVAYLGKALWPSGLAVFYPHRGESIPGWQVAGSALLLIAVTVLSLLAARRRPYLAVGWLWYLGTLLPAVGLIQVGSQAMADRYMYLPLVGLAIAVAWGAPELFAPSRAGRAALGAAAVAVIAALAVGSVLQLRHWRDSEALFRRALRVTEGNAIAHAHLGAALLEQGRTADTILHYRRALETNPRYLQVLNNLAWLLATLPDENLRDPEAALRLAQRAARQTDHEDPAVLDTLAAAHAANERFARAVRTAQRALALAEARGEEALAEALRARLALYRAGRPYREDSLGAGRPSASAARRATR
jgi:Tfp pilus assembly protein PilF